MTSIRIRPVDGAYVPGIPACEYVGPPDMVVPSTAGYGWTLAELLSFQPPAFVAVEAPRRQGRVPRTSASVSSDPPALSGQVEPEG